MTLSAGIPEVRLCHPVLGQHRPPELRRNLARRILPRAVRTVDPGPSRPPTTLRPAHSAAVRQRMERVGRGQPCRTLPPGGRALPRSPPPGPRRSRLVRHGRPAGAGDVARNPDPTVVAVVVHWGDPGLTLRLVRSVLDSGLLRRARRCRQRHDTGARAGGRDDAAGPAPERATGPRACRSPTANWRTCTCLTTTCRSGRTRSRPAWSPSKGRGSDRRPGAHQLARAGPVRMRWVYPLDRGAPGGPIAPGAHGDLRVGDRGGPLRHLRSGQGRRVRRQLFPRLRGLRSVRAGLGNGLQHGVLRRHRPTRRQDQPQRRAPAVLQHPQPDLVLPPAKEAVAGCARLDVDGGGRFTPSGRSRHPQAVRLPPQPVGGDGLAPRTGPTPETEPTAAPTSRSPLVGSAGKRSRSRKAGGVRSERPRRCRSRQWCLRGTRRFP